MELISIGYLTGIVTLIGMLFKSIWYLVSISRGSLQMVAEPLEEGMRIQIHNRTGKTIRIYKVILSRTTTVYGTVRTDLDGQFIDDGRAEEFIIAQKDLESILIKVDDELKLSKHKIIKDQSTKIPIRLYIETSEGGMYSQWLLFRRTDIGFEFSDNLQHRGSYYTVSRKPELSNAFLIALILCMIEFVAVCVLINNNPDDAESIRALGLLLLIIMILVSTCYLASYGAKSRVMTVFLSVLAMSPILLFGPSIGDISGLCFLWLYTGILLSVVVLLIAGWGIQSNMKYHDIYVNTECNDDRPGLLSRLINLVKRVLC